jgi:hypothetical protein
LKEAFIEGLLHRLGVVEHVVLHVDHSLERRAAFSDSVALPGM